MSGKSVDDIVPRDWSGQQIKDLAWAIHKVATDPIAEVLIGLTDEDRRRLRFAARQLDVVASLRTGPGLLPGDACLRQRIETARADGAADRLLVLERQRHCVRGRCCYPHGPCEAGASEGQKGPL